MPNPDLERLRGIKTFPSLVKYLREDLDWPIETDNFDDLTFDFEPEELGIDPKTSAKIKSISQLRPLASNQPWGIFFVNFEPKRLPVVALRRILGQLVIKKRASANRADQQTWRLSDLLFLSNYGENEQRQITFAHFSGNEDSKNLPTLKVLGWDDSDTPLHIDHVHTTLRDKLRWPGDDPDLDIWRESWSSAFTLRHGEVIKTSKELAVKLAGLAQKIRKRANSILSIETDCGPLSMLMKGFKEALIHDLTEDAFADMYAQTIAYGLLTARITNPKGDNPDELSRQMPITNPFLKELMESFLSVGGRKGKSGTGVGIDFDELGINEVVDLLDNSNMEAVVRDFGDKNPLEDPVIHFYELFLHEYDSEIRMQRGVFYTPRPVVSFIVRSVDELLRKEFGLEDGLADTTTWGEMVKRNKDFKIPEGAKPDDPFIQILDPATGTGTFLVEAIDLIHKTMVEKWEDEGNSEKKIEQLWNDYVPKYLLPRLHGYELLMAPYAIAHMKIGLKLFETNYHFGSEERSRIYLTNALEPSSKDDKQLSFSGMFPALAHEVEAVNAIKGKKCFTVVIGNPPYSNLSANLSKSARELVEPYKFIAGDKIREKGALSLEKNLNDDYVKFVRYVEQAVFRSGIGVSGLITNSGYLTSPTLRGMRWGLIQNYTTIYLLNLFGYAGASTRVPVGLPDKNIFDIGSAGVAVNFGVCGVVAGEQKIWYSEKWGTREEKYQFLSKNTALSVQRSELLPSKPFFVLEPSDTIKQEEYNNWPQLLKLFEVNSTGIRTLRDHFVIDFESKPILKRVRNFATSVKNDKELCSELELSTPGWWNIQKSRENLKADLEHMESFMRKINYRPFDSRCIFYHDALVGSPRRPVMVHLENYKRNIGLHVCRQLSSPSWQHIFVTRDLADDCYVSSRTRERGYTVPLFLVSKKSGLFAEDPIPNLDLELFLRCLGDSERITPNSAFSYVYGILYSPNFRRRYLDFLKRDFPHIPIASNQDCFCAVAELGDELIAFHLMESPKLQEHITELKGSGEFRVEKISYSSETVFINKAQTMGFGNISEEIWNFHVGGYQVCEKWLKDRGPKKGKPGRVLTKEDIEHYQKIIVAISETIRIMAEIDEVIEEHGGWPGAFVTE
jgi:hypothetical protein